MFLNHFKRNKSYLTEGGRALGICARTGQEIKALNQLGMDAIGIDIVAYPPLVVFGDAHKLPFKAKQFDFVFSNSLDHSIYPRLFINEMLRVLKTNGYGMLHLQITDKVDEYAENIILDEKAVISFIKILNELKGEKIFLYRTNEKAREKLGFKTPLLVISFKLAGEEKPLTFAVSDILDEKGSGLIHKKGEVYLLQILNKDLKRILVSPEYFFLE